MKTIPRNQRGATLIVSLIMLLLITLLAVSSFTLGKSNLQIVVVGPRHPGKDPRR